MVGESMEIKTIKQTNISNPNGTKFLISTVLYAFGDYETMVLEPDGGDLEEHHTKQEDEALRIHNKFIKQYTQKVEKPVKLTGRYLELSKHLKIAAEEAKPLGDTEDGGTCNFDSLQLKLPRYNERLTIAAMEAAGLTGYKATFWKLAFFVVSPPINRQANARTRQARKMEKVMSKLGYDASVYYRMD